MTKQLNNYCEPWTSINAIKKLWKDRNSIQKQIEQKNYKNLSFFNLRFYSTGKHKAEKSSFEISAMKTSKTMGNSYKAKKLF